MSLRRSLVVAVMATGVVAACVGGSTTADTKSAPDASIGPGVDPPPPANEEDGGSVVTKDGDAGDASKPTDAAADARTDAAAGVCSGNPQTVPFGGALCQDCLEENCCAQLKGCFTLPKVFPLHNCDSYSDCIAFCDQFADPVATCYATTCDGAHASPGVETAYGAIVTCAQASCQLPCGF